MPFPLLDLGPEGFTHLQLLESLSFPQETLFWVPEQFSPRAPPRWRRTPSSLRLVPPGNLCIRDVRLRLRPPGIAGSLRRPQRCRMGVKPRLCQRRFPRLLEWRWWQAGVIAWRLACWTLW
jgi:hypothetical protein